MQLLTQDVRNKLPALYATEDVPTEDKTVHIKFFTPWTGWTWYAVEGSIRLVSDKGETEYLPLSTARLTDLDEAVRNGACDVIFFGYVDGTFPEWGYFSLNELTRVQGPVGLKVERDLYFEPKPFGDLNT